MRGFVVLNCGSSRVALFGSSLLKYVERSESGGILLNACYLLLASNLEVSHCAVGIISPELVADSAVVHTSHLPYFQRCTNAS
jgi:hypothetical protein